MKTEEKDQATPTKSSATAEALSECCDVSQGSLGLRERKRMKTRVTIERAAVTLVGEKGYKNVTVDDICEKAEVSHRTFFNYFPSKEAAILGPAPEWNDDVDVDEVFQRVPESLLLGILLFFEEMIPKGETPDLEIEELREEIARKEPDLLHLYYLKDFQFEQDVHEAVEGYLERNPEKRMLPDAACETEAHITVNLALSALHYSFCTMVKRKKPYKQFQDGAQECLMLTKQVLERYRENL